MEPARNSDAGDERRWGTEFDPWRMSGDLTWMGGLQKQKWSVVVFHSHVTTLPQSKVEAVRTPCICFPFSMVASLDLTDLLRHALRP